MAQGITLGALLQGIRITERAYAGGWWDWLTPFSLLTSAGVVVGYAVVVEYALLGACWLVWKTQGSLHDKAYTRARWAGALLLMAITAVSLATLSLEPKYSKRWLAFPRIEATAQVQLATTVVSVMFFRALSARREDLPFALALALFGLTFIGSAFRSGRT